MGFFERLPPIYIIPIRIIDNSQKEREARIQRRGGRLQSHLVRRGIKKLLLYLRRNPLRRGNLRSALCQLLSHFLRAERAIRNSLFEELKILLNSSLVLSDGRKKRAILRKRRSIGKPRTSPDEERERGGNIGQGASREKTALDDQRGSRHGTCAPRDVGKYGCKENIACDIVENEEVVEEIAGEKTCQNTALRKNERIAAPQHPQCRSKDRKVRDKTHETSRDEPVENAVVHTIKPRLLPVHPRVVILVEDDRIIFLSPTEDGSLFHPLPRDTHVEKTRFNSAVSSGDCCEPI